MVLPLPFTRRTRPSGSPGTPTVVAEQLRRHGWTARRVEYDCGVDPDLRLRVAPGAGETAVELLLPLDGCAVRQWQAVREQAVRERAVWSGPDGSCPPEELVAFLESLLLRPEHELAARYTRLG